MNSKFDRRRFLIGGGSIIALPLFESLVSPRVLAQAMPPTKLILMKFPNGVFKNSWSPVGTGVNYTLPDALSSLNAYRSDLLMLTGLNNSPADAGPDGAGDHGRSGGTFLTSVRVNKSEQDIRAGVSIDRLIAERLNLTAAPNWMVLAAPGTGYGDSGYGPAYTSNISWISATTPAARVTDTRNAFDILFPNAANPPPISETERKNRYRRSILDGAISEAATLNARLSNSDRQKLDEYLTSVREVERGIATNNNQNPLACSPGANPGSTGNDFANFTRTMMNLIVLAAQCDRTRVVSYFMDYEGSNRGGIGGVNQGHHTVSHYPDNPDVYPAQYRQINRWYAEQFAYFVGRMKAVTSANGQSLLQSTAIVFGSNIHDGNEHAHSNLPILIAGRANGTITTGRQMAANAQIANLWVSLAQRMGTNVTSHGNSTGTIAL